MRTSVSMGLAAGILGMGIASAGIKVSDALSLSGFIDMSATAGLPDTGPKSLTASFDQFELDFLYTFSDKLSAQVDVNSIGGGALELEQAFIAYTAGPATLYAGKFLSATGFEAAEPTGLYQYSYSRNCDRTVGGCVYGGYQNGVAVSYTVSPLISLYGALVGSVWDGTDTDLKSPGYEAQVSLTPLEGLTAKLAYAADIDLAEDDGGDTGVSILSNQSLVNVWVSYATGPLTVAGEVNYLMDWGTTDEKGLGYLVMANYKLTDKFGITGRYSALKLDSMGAADNEITVSPGYAISDAWFVLAEAKHGIEAKNTTFAVESLITF